jgi:uncharacterized membrane protein (UPF0136 family)
MTIKWLTLMAKIKTSTIAMACLATVLLVAPASYFFIKARKARVPASATPTKVIPAPSNQVPLGRQTLKL